MRGLWGRVKVLLLQHIRDLEADETVTDTATTSTNEGATVAATPSVPPVPTTTEPGGAPAPEAPEAPADSSPEPSPEPSAATEPDPTPSPPEPAEPAEAKARRGRGALEADVKTVCDQYVTGGLVLADGDHLTAHKIANNIKTMHSLSEPPSSGAVTAVLERWKEIGYANLNDKPKAFTDYTDAGRTEGLTALKAKAAEEKRATRAAAKLASKAAATPPATESTPADSEPAAEGGSEPF